MNLKIFSKHNIDMLLGIGIGSQKSEPRDLFFLIWKRTYKHVITCFKVSLRGIYI